jgi:hypothetical protein
MHVLAHQPTLVALHDKLKDARLVRSRGGGVGTDNRVALGVLERVGALEEHAGGHREAGSVAVGELKYIAAREKTWFAC